MKKISFIPYRWKENKYIDLVKEIYIKAGLQEVKYSLLANDITFVSLNDYEGLPEKKSKAIVQFFLRYLGLLFIRLKRQQIIWTVHDVQPHYTKNEKFAHLLRKAIMNQNPVVLMHSRLTKKVFNNFYPEFELSNFLYFPHPNYVNEYGQEIRKKTSDDELILLYMGLINPYKNLDMLISVFNELNLKNTKLIIRGSVKDGRQKYYENLIDKNPNIDAKFGFVDDSDIPELFSKAHITVTPYDLEVSLNSGANILSFSYATTVLGVLNGTLKDIPDKKMFFSYEYTSIGEHKEKLKYCLKTLHTQYEGHFNELNKIGKKSKEFVEKNYSVDSIAESLKKDLEKIEK